MKNPADTLEDIGDVIVQLEELNEHLDQLVVAARRQRCTWLEIAEAADMTKQAAWQRWRLLTDLDPVNR